MRESRMFVHNHRVMLNMACRCCGQHTVREVIDLGAQPQANRLVKPDLPIGSEPVYPLRLGYCESCTMMQIDHTVPRDDMFRDYVYVSGTTDTLKRHFAATTDRLRKTYEIKPYDLVVDIGSNDGTWLKTWKGLARNMGVEPANALARQANAEGVTTWNRYFDADAARDIAAGPGRAKLITSAGSFFHMEDLHGACDGVKNLLAPDGVFVVQAISGADMIFGNAFDQVLHEHLLFYTVKSFSELMRRHDLEVFNVKHHDIHGGTNEYHVGHPGVRQAKLPPSAYYRMETETFENVMFEDCEKFAHRVMKMRGELIETLERYRAEGKSVWAYGAPGKGSTMLNSFGIDTNLVQCAVEKNPIKWGLSMPGCRVPIIPEGGAHPDAYLVLAWNFLPEFIQKEKAFLDAGGEFIVPVPNVRIINRKNMEKAA